MKDDAGHLVSAPAALHQTSDKGIAMSLSEKPWFRKFLVSLVGKPLLKGFEASSHCLRQTQEQLLEKMIASERG